MAIKAEMEDRLGSMVVVDEYGDEWDVVASDGRHHAIERDGGDRWEVGTFDGNAISVAREGGTFGVSCQDEFCVRRVDSAGSLRWVEND